jgi:hypothetical protein
MIQHRSGGMLMPVAVLLMTAGAAAQEPARPMIAGCPDAPADFHPCALEKAKTYNPPRTPEGHPDLSGIWRGRTGGTENIEEHGKTFDTSAGPSLVVDPPDGKVPFQPWAAAQAVRNIATFIEPAVPCFPAGVPRSMYQPPDFQLIQTPGYIAVITERAHNFFVVPMDGRPHVSGRILLWQGDQRGHWEGNTLVVDVTNQNARTWFDQQGRFYSDAVHMVERFTPVDANTMDYEVTIEDPNVYTRPWKMAFAMRRVTQAGYEFFEEACHEGENNTKHRINLGQKPYPGIHGRELK